MRDYFFRFGYSVQLHRLSQKFISGKKVIVLCLHRVNPGKDQFFAPLHPDVFAHFVRQLKKEYSILSIEEARHIVQNNKAVKKPIVILTFDDGYKDFVEYAMPVIKAEKIPVNHNIVAHCAMSGQLIWTQRINNLLQNILSTGQSLNIESGDFNFKQESGMKPLQIKQTLFKYLFSRAYSEIVAFTDQLEQQYSFRQPVGEMMDWDDIRTCHSEGVEIGSHTTFHSSLNIVTDVEFMGKEIVASKTQIEQEIGSKVTSFAFPNGLASAESYKMVIDAGYTNLLLIEGVSYSFKLQPVDTVFPLKRVLIGHKTAYENMFNVAGFHNAFHG